MAGRFSPRYDHSCVEDFSTPTSPPLTSHPVVRLLYHEPMVVQKARIWAFRSQGPTHVANDGQNWPPKYPSQLQAVAAYWHFHLMREYRENANRPVFNGILDMFEYAMDRVTEDAGQQC